MVSKDMIHDYHGTYSRNCGLRNTSVHDVSANTEANHEEAYDDPVAYLRPVHPFVVCPWLGIAAYKHEPRQNKREAYDHSLSSEPETFESMLRPP